MTPIQELIEKLKEEAQFISDDDHLEDRMWRNGMREAIEIAESMLEKEKEVMCEFAWEYERECRINLERSIEKCWYETFKTEEK
jgi:formyltetrahydrofolate synthetase